MPDPQEQIEQIPIAEIRPFRNHPFKVTDDELMQQTVDSIKQVGILNPTIIRPVPEGGYEMVAGYRRQRAAELAGLDSIPAIVRNLTDDEAVILMVDSNLKKSSPVQSKLPENFGKKVSGENHFPKGSLLTDSSLMPRLPTQHIAAASPWVVIRRLLCISSVNCRNGCIDR